MMVLHNVKTLYPLTLNHTHQNNTEILLHFHILLSLWGHLVLKMYMLNNNTHILCFHVLWGLFIVICTNHIISPYSNPTHHRKLSAFLGFQKQTNKQSLYTLFSSRGPKHFPKRTRISDIAIFVVVREI